MGQRNSFGKLEKILNSITEPKKALLLITVISFFLRILPMRFRYLLGYDPYFHLAYIRYALSHGWVNFFSYARGPWGFQIRLFHPLGLWMTPAYLYKVLKFLGLSLYNTFRLTPVIFGVLTIILVYLSLLELYGRRKAFFGALLLAVSFGHIFRSMAGYYRGDNYMVFWLSLIHISEPTRPY
jgi:asparagine N-glycosylation enzyme membrane subunit Stt3